MDIFWGWGKGRDWRRTNLDAVRNEIYRLFENGSSDFDTIWLEMSRARNLLRSNLICHGTSALQSKKKRGGKYEIFIKLSPNQR